MAWPAQKLSTVAASILVFGHIALILYGFLVMILGVLELDRLLQLLVIQLPAIWTVAVPALSHALRPMTSHGSSKQRQHHRETAVVVITLLTIVMLLLFGVLTAGLWHSLNQPAAIYFIAFIDLLMVLYIGTIKENIFPAKERKDG